jgi:hypothetical protein
VPVLEFLRQYTLREYTAVFAVALIGAAGVVFMLSAASGGTASNSEDLLLKRQTASRTAPISVRSAELERAAAVERAKRARAIAARHRLREQRAQRAARRAAVLAAARARHTGGRTAVRSTPRPAASAPTPVVIRTPSPAPQQERVVAPAPKPTPKTSGTTGGGGGSFDDSG